MNASGGRAEMWGRRLKWRVGGGWLVCALLLVLAWPARGENPSAYDDSFTFKNGKPFIVDPFTWAYTREFAETFDMPARWIEPGLKGVLGVAWRLTTVGNVICGNEGEANNCRKPLACQMDVYYDTSVPLPWNYPEVVSDNMWDGIASTTHLPDITNARGIRRYLRDSSRPKGVMSSGGALVYGNQAKERADIVYFDREYQPGVGLIGYVGPGVCPNLNAAGPASMIFVRPEEAGAPQQGHIPTMHVMEFPESYLGRLREIYATVNHGGKETTDRLLGQVSDWTGLSYEDVHRFHGKPYVRDPFLWAYSAEFAEKYRMPAEWIEPDLKGALAIAWRMSTIGDLNCGYSGRKESCWSQVDCQMDIYLDGNAPLPWNYPHVMRDNQERSMSSKQFLKGLAWKSRLLIYTGNQSGERSKGIINSGGSMRYNKYSHGYSFLVYYDRDFGGMQVLTYRGDGYCPDLKLDGSSTTKYYSRSSIERTGDGKTELTDTDVVHVIEFPRSLLARLKPVYAAGKGPIDDTLNRMLNDFLKSRK
ncbi:MAG: hypothetical protein H7840_16545 [Alphaproteobacteria bacterium]